MRATNKLRPKVRQWWMEPEDKCREMAEKAERLARMRSGIVRQRQRHADDMHAIGYSTHMGTALESACASVGVSLEFVTQRSIMGNLLRGDGRAQKRADVFRILRAHGYSYPEIALAFGTCHSTVIAALKGNHAEPKRTWSGPYQAQDAA